ncbi:MAG: hypothetical protein LBG19_04410 [Prevotellaceae bacterium]|jgi:hypothetical protein|nr:hypothetical protein [Prevotellaceae bacterium]
MKNRLLLFVLILPLLVPVLFSCTYSREDDIIFYVLKQVRELYKENDKEVVKVIYSLTYDSDGKLKTEGDTLYTANLCYNNEILVDSVRVIYKANSGSTVDSIHRIFTYNESDIAVRLVTFIKNQPEETATGKVMLNAELLPISYIIGNNEERYAYDAENKLTTVECYENSTLKWTRTYDYQGDNGNEYKSPYDEVQHFPAWYFVAYRHMSPVGLAIKSTLEEAGLAPAIEYEMKDFITSDLDFVTKCSRTYHENGDTREVTYRQDYRKVVFD